MQCPKCGAENPVNRIYCGQCGAELEHDLASIQATVDREVRDEKTKAAGRTIRWFFVASFVVLAVGYTFRRAYKDLPQNEIVAFASAPTVEVNDDVAVETREFGVGLSALPPTRHPAATAKDPEILQALADAAYRRAAVTVKQKGMPRPLEGLLAGDVVFYVPAAANAEPKPVHIAEVRALKPADDGHWEIQALSLPAPTRIPIENAENIQIQLLIRQPEGKIRKQPIPLATIEQISPL